MAQYIDKFALVAEIEKRIENCAKQREDMLNVQCYILADDASARMGELNCIQDFLNTLEVKEVDLEKEIDNYLDDNFYISETWGIFSEKTENEINQSDLENIAKHFFEQLDEYIDELENKQ